MLPFVSNEPEVKSVSPDLAIRSLPSLTTQRIKFSPAAAVVTGLPYWSLTSAVSLISSFGKTSVTASSALCSLIALAYVAVTASTVVGAAASPSTTVKLAVDVSITLLSASTTSSLIATLASLANVRTSSLIETTSLPSLAVTVYSLPSAFVKGKLLYHVC